MISLHLFSFVDSSFLRKILEDSSSVERAPKMELVRIEIDHKVDEHVRAERLYYAKASRMVIVDRVVAVLLLIFGIFCVATLGVRWWTIIWFVLAPLEFFNLLSIAPLVVRYRFKNTPKFFERNELTFSEEGIHLKTPTIDSDLKWNIYKDIIEGKDLILLIYGKSVYTVIPKRCFSEEDLRTFQALAERKIKRV